MYCAFSSPVKIQSANFFPLCASTAVQRGKLGCTSMSKNKPSDGLLLVVLQQPSALPAVTWGLFCVLGWDCHRGYGECAAFPAWGILPGTPSQMTELWLNYTGREERKAKFVLRQRVKLARVWVCSRLAVDETFFKHDNCKFCHNFPLTKL